MVYEVCPTSLQLFCDVTDCGPFSVRGVLGAWVIRPIIKGCWGPCTIVRPCLSSLP